MSLKDKASKIDFGSLPGAQVQTPGAEAAAAIIRPKTAPGLMMAHAADQRSELLRENETLKIKVSELGSSAARAAELQDELKAWDGAKATRLIDTRLISRSKWANRDERHFLTPEFEQLKSEIAHAGGNVQPIKVRPLPTVVGDGTRYELVFGHRRFEACQQLGLFVLALVDNLDDRSLFIEMDRENRSRKDLSAWEQGVMYRRALDEGLFPSNRKLAEIVGVDLTQVGKALALARLPLEVVDAFPTPLDLQFRWAKPLTDAGEIDRVGLVARAKKAKELGSNRTSKEVLELLLGPEEQGGGTVLPPPILIERDGKLVATVELDSKGRASISFARSVVTASHMKALSEMVEAFLSKATKHKK